jgi:two-component system, NarL family, sensor histidine kinase UhpB
MDSPRCADEAGGVSGQVDQREQRDTGEPVWSPVSALFWRTFALNALMFVGATAALAMSPATVSLPVSVKELIVLAVGLVLMLVVNAVLLRASLRPLDGLTDLMKRVDLLRPGQRAPVGGNGDVVHLIRSFNDMLDRLEAERGASAGRTLAAQEGERQRIAQELHDEIGQSLTAVLLGLKRLIDRAPAELGDELGAVQDITRGSLNEVRQVARRLRPGVLDDLGLAPALSALAMDFTTASEVPTSTQVDERLPPLDSAAELVIYRIAQEGLTNTARHADAHHVELSLTGDEQSVVLRVGDDGRGMNGAVEGAGIRGMRERAILIGADLTIGTGHAGGTEVRLVVPHGDRG